MTTRIGLFSWKVVQFLYVLQNHVFGKNLFSLVFSKWRLKKCKTLRSVEKMDWNGFILFLKWIVEYCVELCEKSFVSNSCITIEVRSPKFKMADLRWRRKMIKNEIWRKNLVPWVFKDAEYESEFRSETFKMADPIWRTEPYK